MKSIKVKVHQISQGFEWSSPDMGFPEWHPMPSWVKYKYDCKDYLNEYLNTYDIHPKEHIDPKIEYVN